MQRARVTRKRLSCCECYVVVGVVDAATGAAGPQHYPLPIRLREPPCQRLVEGLGTGEMECRGVADNEPMFPAFPKEPERSDNDTVCSGAAPPHCRNALAGNMPAPLEPE